MSITAVAIALVLTAAPLSSDPSVVVAVHEDNARLGVLKCGALNDAFPGRLKCAVLPEEVDGAQVIVYADDPSDQLPFDVCYALGELRSPGVSCDYLPADDAPPSPYVI